MQKWIAKRTRKTRTESGTRELIHRLGGKLKAPTCNRLYDNLRQLEDHLIAIARECTDPEKLSSLIHDWMRDQANAGALK